MKAVFDNFSKAKVVKINHRAIGADDGCWQVNARGH